MRERLAMTGWHWVVWIALALLGTAPANAQGVVYVDANAGGLNNGSSWSNAYTSLRIALLSSTNAEVWVADGTYSPAGPVPAVTDTFALRNNRVYGGFLGDGPGGGETQRDERDPAANPVVLTGNLGGINAKSVVTKTGALFTGTNVLDGVVVRDGRGNLATEHGAGLLVTTGALYVANCTFVTNFVKLGNGGAIYANVKNGFLSVSNSAFGLNRAAAGAGGAIYAVASRLPLELVGVTFQTNRAATTGGDLHVAATTFKQAVGVFRSRMSDSQSVQNGGSLYLANAAEQRIGDCSFSAVASSGNGAYAGGAIYSVNATGVRVETNTFTTCSVTGNGATSGGAIYHATGALTVDGCSFRNCSVTGTGSTGGGAIYQAGGPLTVIGSRFLDCSTAATGGSGGAIYTATTGAGVSITGSLFSGVTSFSSGAAVYQSAVPTGPIEIGGCQFTNCALTSAGSGLRGGGALYLAGSATQPVAIRDSVFGSINGGGVSATTTVDGGAVYIGTASAVSVTNSIFTGIMKPNRGGGGALRVGAAATAVVTLRDLVFRSITNDLGAGGAVYVSSAATIDVANTSFEDVSSGAGNGGGICSVANASFLMSGVTFTNVTITGSGGSLAGGAVYHSGGNALRAFQVLNCDFDRIYRMNSGTRDAGGAVYLSGSGDLSISGSRFRNIWKNNNGGGGAVSAWSSGNITVSDTTFTSITNRLGNGGALALSGATGMVTITNVTVEGIGCGTHISAGLGQGGAIWSDSPADHVIDGLTVRDVTNSLAATHQYGGGLYIGRSGVKSTVIRNTAFEQIIRTASGTLDAGGAAWISGTGDVTIESTRFSRIYKNNNGVGGALVLTSPAANPGTLTVRNCSFDSITNRLGAGGAVYVGSGNLVMTSNRFDTIQGGFSGGAVYLAMTGSKTLSDMTFTNIVMNYLTGGAANPQGGAIYISGASAATLRGLVIGGVSNLHATPTSTIDGGAVYITGATTAMITNCLIKSIVKNYRGYGGAVYMNSSVRGLFASSTIDTANTGDGSGVTAYGGGFYGGGAGTIDVHDVLIMNTRSSQLGSALAAETGPKNLVGVTITNVTTDVVTGAASVRGYGAIYMSGASAALLRGVSVNGANNYHNQPTGSIDGGALFVTGATTIQVTNSVFRNISKDKRGYGGALYLNSTTGTKVLTSTIDTAGNGDGTGAFSYGGGIYVSGAGALEVSDTWIERTRAEQYGAGLMSQGTGAQRFWNVTVTNATLNVATAALGQGGGMYVVGAGANPVSIRNSTFSAITAGPMATSTVDGGGIYVNNTTGGILVSNTVFRQIAKANKSSSGGGGGGARLVTTGTLRVADSRFEAITAVTGSDASSPGGGVKIETANMVVITNSVFTNVTASAGGAIYSAATSGHLIADSNIQSSRAQGTGGDGGGICLAGAMTQPARILRTVLKDNSAPDLGGGIYMARAPAGSSLVSSLVAENTSGSGGGIYFGTVAADALAVLHSTIAHNAAAATGGGLFANVGRFSVTNSIIHGNTAPVGPAGQSTSGSDLAYTFAPFESGFSGVAPSTVGSSTADPLLRHVAGGDYRLGYGSPAIDLVPVSHATASPDVERVARPIGTGWDAGAYETNPSQLVPEITVMGNGMEIANGDAVPEAGDHTDFGTTSAAGGSVVRTFTIRNDGQHLLNMTGTPRVTVSGPQAGEFSVTTQPESPAAPFGGSVTFRVEFRPAAVGVRGATISIPNDDADENPYTFAIQGTGAAVAPEIRIEGAGLEIADGDDTPAAEDGTDFGSTTFGVPVTHTFTVLNPANGDLHLTNSPLVAVSGSPYFSVTVQPGDSVAGLSSTTFNVMFNPLAHGTHEAVISIRNDDSDEDPYEYSVQGVLPGKALSVSIVPPAGGTTDPAAGLTVFPEGSNVTVVARAASNYVFSAWAGDTGGGTIDGDRITLLMSTNRAITAYFLLAAGDSIQWTGMGDGTSYVDDFNWLPNEPRPQDRAVFGDLDFVDLVLGGDRTLAALSLSEGRSQRSRIRLPNPGPTNTFSIGSLLIAKGGAPGAPAAQGELLFGSRNRVNIRDVLTIGEGGLVTGLLVMVGGELNVGTALSPATRVRVGHLAEAGSVSRPDPETYGSLMLLDGRVRMVMRDLQIGLASAGSGDHEMFSAGWLTIGDADVSIVTTNLQVGTGQAGFGYLDARGATRPVDIRTENLDVGKSAVVGYFNNYRGVGNIWMGSFDTLSTQRLSVARMMTVATLYGGNGTVDFGANSELSAGSPERRADALIGHYYGGWSTKSGGEVTGIVDIHDSGRLSLWLDSLVLGKNDYIGNSSDRGVDCYATLNCTNGVFEPGGNVMNCNTVLVGHAGPGRIRFTNPQRSRTRNGFLRLGRGRVEVGTLIAGLDPQFDSLGSPWFSGSATVSLFGTQVHITNRLDLIDQCDITVHVNGQPSGFDIDSGAAVRVVLDYSSPMRLTFYNPSPGFKGEYWGFRWKGYHVPELNSLITGGKIAVIRKCEPYYGAISNYYDSVTGYTYIGFGVQNVPDGDADDDGLPDTWEQQYFNSLAPAPDVDSDDDGMSNMDEYIAGTHPSNDVSRFNLLIVNPGRTNASVQLKTYRAEGTNYYRRARYYSLEQSTNLLWPSWTLVPGRSNVLGRGQTVTYVESGTNRPRYFRGKVWLEAQ